MITKCVLYHWITTTAFTSNPGHDTKSGIRPYLEYAFDQKERILGFMIFGWKVDLATAVAKKVGGPVILLPGVQLSCKTP